MKAQNIFYYGMVLHDYICCKGGVIESCFFDKNAVCTVL